MTSQEIDARIAEIDAIRDAQWKRFLMHEITLTQLQDSTFNEEYTALVKERNNKPKTKKKIELPDHLEKYDNYDAINLDKSGYITEFIETYEDYVWGGVCLERQ